jgi:hypothetical protein
MSNNWNAIDVMAIVLAGQSERIIPMLNGFALEGQETDQLMRLLAMYLNDDGLTANVPDELLQMYVDKAVEKINQVREICF